MRFINYIKMAAKMARWKEFAGSDEQIKEITKAKHGWIVRFVDGSQSEILIGPYEKDSIHMKDTMAITEYLICEFNPHAEMIERWAMTGQPVYKFDEYDNEWKLIHDPKWVATTKYSFNPPKKKKYIEVRSYLIKKFGNYMVMTINKNGNDHQAIIRNHPDFVRWIDDDWRKVEI